MYASIKTSIAQWNGEGTSDNLFESCFMFCFIPSFLQVFFDIIFSSKGLINTEINWNSRTLGSRPLRPIVTAISENEKKSSQIFKVSYRKRLSICAGFCSSPQTEEPFLWAQWLNIGLGACYHISVTEVSASTDKTPTTRSPHNSSFSFRVRDSSRVSCILRKPNSKHKLCRICKSELEWNDNKG